MIRVAKNDLSAKFLELRLCNRLHRPRGSHGHEYRRPNFAVIGDKFSQARFCFRIFGENFKAQIISLSNSFEKSKHRTCRIEEAKAEPISPVAILMLPLAATS
jgi:hypothetical protein